MPTFPLLSWSPDGIYYASAWVTSKKIAINERSTGETSFIPLEGSFTWFYGVDWSPTGKFLAFLTSDVDGRHTIWTISPEGGSQSKVVEESHRIQSPRWSGDGAAIYYMANRTEMPNTAGLWKIRTRPGSTGDAAADPAIVLAGLDVLLSGESTRGALVSISDDGDRLVYPKGRSQSNLWLVTTGDDPEGELVVTNRITSGTFDDHLQRVSPSGNQIAFIRNGDVYTVPVSGGSAQQLTFTEAREASPAWSPDGTWIAFGSNEGGIARVHKVLAQGGTPQPFVKTNLDNENLYVTWAPGSRILYQTSGNRNFHLLDPDTEEETPLIKDDSVGWAFDAEYSPDGTQIAVWWNRPPSGGLWVISLKDSSEIHVSEHPINPHTPPGWSADGVWIYSRQEGGDIVKMPVSGGEPETILKWPFEEKTGGCVRDPDASLWVCNVVESSSDIWLVENFDPDPS